MADQSRNLTTQSRAVLGGRHSRLLACALFGLTAVQTAYAAGTVAGTNIENIASATFDTPAGPITIQSNTVVIKVDELLDVLVASIDTGDVLTAPGAAGSVLSYQVTNTGNGNEAFTLEAVVANGGDNFDPALQQIAIDSNGNGVYDAGIDTAYVPGTNNPVIAPDQSIRVFLISSTPVGVANGDRAEVRLTATANTGSGAPGTSFAAVGQGGGDAVVGTTGANGGDSGFLAVRAASLTLIKSATFQDPFGGTRRIPGTIITYSITANVTGSGSLNNLIITDPIPVGVTYQVGTITLQNTALTDVADADAGNFDGTLISVAAGSLLPGQTRTISFRAKIP